MNLLTALAISIGALGGAATWAFVGHGQGLQIWAAFIAWGAFYHSGGGTDGLKNTIICNILGIVVGWICLLLITATTLGDSLGLPVWAGVVVAFGAAAMVIAANVPALATIPASVYGFAATAGYALLAGKVGAENLMATSLADNPLIVITLSMVIGAVLGFVSEKLGGMLAASPAEPAAETE